MEITEVLQASHVASEVSTVKILKNHSYVCDNGKKWKFDTFATFIEFNNQLETAIKENCDSMTFYDIEIEDILKQVLIHSGYNLIDGTVSSNGNQVEFLNVSWKHLIDYEKVDIELKVVNELKELAGKLVESNNRILEQHDRQLPPIFIPSLSHKL